MAVPTFELFLAPTLSALADGQAQSIHDTRDLVAWHFDLDETDRTVMTRGKSNTQLHDRVTWAMTYLFQARLVERTRRGHYRITERGLETLKGIESGDKLNREYLERFSEYREFKERRADKEGGEEGRRRERPDRKAAETDAEAMDRHYEAHVEKVTEELAETLRQGQPGLIRPLLARLLAAVGLGVSPSHVENLLTVGRDGTIEGEFWADPLRRSKVHVRVLLTNHVVGSESVQAMVRLVASRRIQSGILIALGGFSEEARTTAELIDKELSLIDSEELAEVLISQGIGVIPQETFTLYILDPALQTAQSQQ
jgi:restriction system protein